MAVDGAALAALLATEKHVKKSIDHHLKIEI